MGRDRRQLRQKVGDHRVRLIADEETVKMCAERFNWGVGTVFTTAEQVDWKGDSAIGCPKERLRSGWEDPILDTLGTDPKFLPKGGSAARSV